jgi:archaellum component FlaC
MEQSDIDALMNMGKSSKKAKAAFSDAKSVSETLPETKPKEEIAPAPKQTPPAPEPIASAPAASASAPNPVSTTGPKEDSKPKVVAEISAVTAVTERETNKVMDKLDMISQSLDNQKNIITAMMGHESAQAPAIQEAIHQIMSAASDIQNKIYDAMDLMQFQDITRQKLERIILHLRQIHDYIVELLGTGFKTDEQQHPPISVGRTIAQTGTTPDENKEHADSVVEEFRQAKK